MNTYELDGYSFCYRYQFGDTYVNVYKNEHGDVAEVAEDHSYSSSYSER